MYPDRIIFSHYPTFYPRLTIIVIISCRICVYVTFIHVVTDRVKAATKYQIVFYCRFCTILENLKGNPTFTWIATQTL